MSKYINSLKSESPASLYVFDQDPPGTVGDQGFSGTNLSVTESGVSLKRVPSIIPGVRWSVQPTVAYESGITHYSRYIASVWPEWSNFMTINQDWTVESVFVTGNSTRSQAGDNENLIWGFNDGSANGLVLRAVETATGWTLSVTLRLDDNSLADILTYEVGKGEFVHSAVINSEDNFSLMVNGFIVATGQVADGFDVHGDTYDTLLIGGRNATQHSNLAALGSVAFMRRAIPPTRIAERYEYFTEDNDISDYLIGMGPESVLAPEGDGYAVLAPELDDLFEGADTELRYTNTDTVTIEAAALAAPVTFYKKNSYDLTTLGVIGPVYHDFESTAPANTTVVAEYSFDDVSYSTFPTGEDAIPEINQLWAQAGEGTL